MKNNRLAKFASFIALLLSASFALFALSACSAGVESVNFAESQISLSCGSYKFVAYTIYPTDIKEPTIKIINSNENIISTKSYGSGSQNYAVGTVKIEAKSVGSATITINVGNKTDKLKVYVTATTQSKSELEIIKETSYENLTKSQMLTIIKWIENRYDYYDKKAGKYTGDKYTETIFKEAAERYNKTVEEIDKIWFRAYKLKYT